MKYWIDTEFHEEPGRLELISIGIVAEDGREYYGVSWDVDKIYPYANPWVKIHVLNPEFLKHPDNKPGSGTRSGQIVMQVDILKLIGDDKNPEFWGYFSDYDWVVFCHIFGTMMDLPRHFPKFCLDLKQTMYEHDIHRSDLPKAFEPEHNALVDARWTKAAYEKVQEIIRGEGQDIADAVDDASSDP